MKLGYTIVYVPDVPEAVAFYRAAFGLEPKFMHDSKLYAEMATGGTVLAFAAEEMAALNDIAVRPNRKADIAAAYQISLVTGEPQKAYDKAVDAGAAPVKKPTEKPWGQVSGFVRDTNGCLVELCSPIDGR